MSQFDTWLLIYGREKAKLVVASKTAILCSPAMPRWVSFQTKGSSVVLKFLLNLL